jgi:hypothetical protein
VSFLSLPSAQLSLQPGVNFVSLVIKMRVSVTFLLRMPSNHDSPDLNLPSRLDCRKEPPCSACKLSLQWTEYPMILWLYFTEFPDNILLNFLRDWILPRIYLYKIYIFTYVYTFIQHICTYRYIMAICLGLHPVTVWHRESYFNCMTLSLSEKWWPLITYFIAFTELQNELIMCSE